MGGHSAFGAGVTVIIVETSNVGVKVGMVGRGVTDAVGVWVGEDVFVGSGDGVDVGFSMMGTGVDCPQAERRKATMIAPITFRFMAHLPNPLRFLYQIGLLLKRRLPNSCSTKKLTADR